MTEQPYCWAKDAARSYDVAIAAIREQLVRERKVLPLPNNPTEERWAREGVAARSTEKEQTRP